MFMIPPSTCSSENVTDIVKILTLEPVVTIMVTYVGRKEKQKIRLNTVKVLPIKRAGHAVKQTVAIGGDANNAEMFSRVMVNESVPRCLDNRTGIGSFAESAVWHLPLCKRCCYRRPSARFR